MPLPKTGYYQIQRLLGEGGMGAVYEAVHRMTGRRVAIKMLRPELAERVDLQGRFFNEARTTSFLDHPGIVRVFDVARTDDGAAYMVMELCPGPSLGSAFRSELRVRTRLGLLGATAQALAYAHAQGVIHRDLKPDNILVTAGTDGPQPKVLDFGIAKLLENAAVGSSPYAVKTRTGSAIGTPLYMSPEQCRGTGGITPASDVYSLGIMLYECVLGRVPFEGGVGEVIVQHLTTPAPRLGDETLINVDPELDPLVAAMLDKAPNVRPSMRDVADVLGRYDEHRRLFELPPQAPMFTMPPAEREVRDGGLGPTMAGALETTPNTAPPVEVPTTPDRPAQRGHSVMLPLVLGLVVAGTAVAGAIYHRQANRRVAATLPPPAPAPTPPPRSPAPPIRDPWTVDSEPPGADVFLPDGTLIGRTPYVADAVLARGERALYVRMAGYRSEVVRYDGAGQSVARMHALVVNKKRFPASTAENKPEKSDSPPTHSSKQTAPKHDDFEVQPLR
jgi:serine/threonine protein kinase